MRRPSAKTVKTIGATSGTGGPGGATAAACQAVARADVAAASSLPLLYPQPGLWQVRATSDHSRRSGRAALFTMANGKIGVGAGVLFCLTGILLLATPSTFIADGTVKAALGLMLGIASVLGVIVGGFIYVAAPFTPRTIPPSRIIRIAAHLLPTSIKDEYLEEWAGWILDLRAPGTPRVRRWIELLTIVLIAAPRLAIALRLAARRAVD